MRIKLRGRNSIGCLALALYAGAMTIHVQSQAVTQNGVAAAPVTITLDEAIHRAEASDAAYASSSAGSKVSSLDKQIAVAGLLPNVTLVNQGLYTEPNGAFAEGGEGLEGPLPKFIANNGVREYISQGLVNETVSLAGAAALKRADAAALQAQAELEIARRGLVAGVTALFYKSLAADHKLAVAKAARDEAADFTRMSDEREKAREAAHADVLKAQLTERQRERDLEDAEVEAKKARLALGVLLFPDPRTAYTLSAPDAAPPLASREDIEAAAAKNNPELKSTLSAMGVSNADVLAARAAYMPNMALNLTYGIDANQFATKGRLDTSTGVQANNLGYSASLTMNIPVWDWLSTEHKVKQSEIKRDAAHMALTATQRRMIARLDEAYSEAQAARNQLDSLDQSASMAAESLRLTKLAYTAGEATALEVVDAENSWVTAANAREDGRVRYETARADLETLTGTL